MRVFHSENATHHPGKEDEHHNRIGLYVRHQHPLIHVTAANITGELIQGADLDRSVDASGTRTYSYAHANATCPVPASRMLTDYGSRSRARAVPDPDGICTLVSDSDSSSSSTHDCDCLSLSSFEASDSSELRYGYDHTIDADFHLDVERLLGTNDTKDEIGVLVKEALIDFAILS